MADAGTSVRIERHFATVGERQVHYRRAGRGPPVILLHEAPLSSEVFEPLMRRLAHSCTVIAPDTPGNGLSEPLGLMMPTMQDFADGLVEFLDEIGIERCVVYGFHSGGQCALALARSHPQRVARLIVNGYLALDDSLRRDIIENYFAPLSIDWSGSHLAWLWSRMREQWDFFPWYRKGLAFRPPFEPPTPDALHQSVREMLAAGDAYRDSYLAAFQYDTAAAVQQLGVPTLITTPRDDILFPGLATIPPTPRCVRVEAADDLAHAERMLADEIVRLEGTLPAPPPSRTRPRIGAAWSRFIVADSLQLHVRRIGETAGRPIVVQHSTVESTRCIEPLATVLASHGPVVAVDLPGRGASEAHAATAVEAIDADSSALSAALESLGLSAARFVGWRGGAVPGLELAARGDRSIAALVAVQPWWPLRAPDDAELERFMPPLLPDTAGTHLLRAWHLLRDQELYEPWYDRRLAAAIRHHEPDLDPSTVQHRLEALLRCGPDAVDHWRAALRYPWRAKLASVRTPVRIGDAMPALSDTLAREFGSTVSLHRFPQADLVALAAVLTQD